MVEPEWFFSALAQSSAAITGLIIAFSAVQYQLERQQRLKRTDELREELINFRNKYSDVVLVMVNGLSPTFSQSQKINEKTDKCLSNPLERESSELKEVIEQDENVERTHTTLIHIHLLRVKRLIDDIEASPEPRSHYLLSKEQFDKLEESTKFLDEFFVGEVSNPDINELFAELGGEKDYEGVSTYFADVFGTREMEEVAVKEVAKWIQTYQPDSIETMVVMELGPEKTGRSIGSWGAVVGELRQNFEIANAKTGYTIIDDQPSSIGNVVIVSGILLLVGVFGPMLFLFTPPQTLSGLTITGWLLYIIQFMLLILSGGITFYLLHIVRKSMNDTS